MSEPQTQPQGEEEVLTPQDVQSANNRNRAVATRPGWIAVVAFVGFVGGLAAFMFHF